MSDNPTDNHPADSTSQPITARGSWFKVLARLWFLRKFDAEPSGNPGVAILVLILCLIAAWVFIDRWQRQPDPEFYADGIPLMGWYVMAVLGLAQLLHWKSFPRPTMGATLLLVLGLIPLPLILVAVGAYFLPPLGFLSAACAVGLYASMYMVRGLRSVTGRTQPAPVLGGVLFTGTFIWASDAVNAIPDIWNPRDSTATVSDDVLADRETALFEQADRIDAALEAVHRDASAKPQAFFLGFAGVGDEKVFAQEIGLASRVLGERFGIGDRQVSLVNDERDLERAPLASVSGLAYALQGLASRMDLEKDILFLSISSHGSEDPAIAVSNSLMPFRDLTPEDLKDALRDAGIRRRVIIISACYAGGFIDSLRDAQTIVITASAADRTSFGCSSDSDLTYFGEAFYRDALPEASSLREAFETAKKAIAKRELGEQVTPSNPQAYFGSDLEAQLSALSGAAAPSTPSSRPISASRSGAAPVRRSSMRARGGPFAPAATRLSYGNFAGAER